MPEDSMEVIYDRLEVNPFQFPECRDVYLASCIIKSVF